MITSVLLPSRRRIACSWARWHLAAWMAVFFLLKMLYFLRFEEPGLEKRFGDSYRRYKANVPRWIPRLRPWDPGGVTGPGPALEGWFLIPGPEPLLKGWTRVKMPHRRKLSWLS